MKKISGKKLIVLMMVLALIIGCTVGGTLAWLITSTDPVVNTFTAGNITLKLEEPGFPKSKTLKFLPGDSFEKDPTVTVSKGSVPCYVRAFMVIWWEDAADDLFDAEDGKDWFYLDSKWQNEYKWHLVEELYDNTGAGKVLGIAMEYRWEDIVDASEGDQVLAPLYSGVNVPGDLTTEQYLSLNNFKITLFAQAVQADGITDQNNDGSVNADDAFAIAGIPDVTLAHCGNQKFSKILEALRAQDVTNDRENSGN